MSQISKAIRKKKTQVASAIGASSSSSLLEGWWNLMHSRRSSWFCSTRRLMEWTSCCMVEIDCCMDVIESYMELMPPLNRGQCLHDLRIANFRLGWRDSLRRGSQTRYVNRNRRRRGHTIIIWIISPQLSIWLHQRLFAEWIRDLHLWLASNSDAWL